MYQLQHHAYINCTVILIFNMLYFQLLITFILQSKSKTNYKYIFLYITIYLISFLIHTNLNYNIFIKFF
jgi:hypothetical protein